MALPSKNHGMQSIEGLIVEISLIRVRSVSWNLPDVSAGTSQAIKVRGGIEGGSK